jgi:hypothetical protein
MNKKTLMIAGAILLVLILGWYFFMRTPTTSAATSTGPSEDRINHNMTWMRKDTKVVADITAKAAKEGRTFEEQLRLDAIWYVEREPKV